MKLICPTCQSRVNIGSASRYDVFECKCGRQFRGIWADLAGVDFIFNKYFNPFTLFSGDAYDSAADTACPYCNSRIRVGHYNSAPDSCWACGRNLPVSKVNVNSKAQVQPPKAQVQPPKAQVQPPKAQVQPPKAQVQPPKAQVQPPKAQVQPPKAQVQPPKAQVQPDPFANYPKNKREQFLNQVEYIRGVLSDPNLFRFIVDKGWTEVELNEAQVLLGLPPFLVKKVKDDLMFKINNRPKHEDEPDDDEDEPDDDDDEDDVCSILEFHDDDDDDDEGFIDVITKISLAELAASKDWIGVAHHESYLQTHSKQLTQHKQNLIAHLQKNKDKYQPQKYTSAIANLEKSIELHSRVK